jgi:hypothetical protein
MDYGVFESANNMQLKFENTQVSLYRFKHDPNDAKLTATAEHDNKENMTSVVAGNRTPVKILASNTKSVQFDYISRMRATNGALSLKKMLENLREKPDKQHKRHNFSELLTHWRLQNCL